MGRFLGHISFLLCMVSAVMSCTGQVDDTGTDSVPEGVLRIFADKNTIAADGAEEVTFKVMFGSLDVSNEPTMQLTRVFADDEKVMAYGVNKFSTVTAGTYRFKATYYFGGYHYSDNEVVIEAAQFYTGEEKDYARRVLATYFTSTGCTSCPLASAGIRTVQAANPGVISVVAFHADMNEADPMTTSHSADFNAALGGFTGLPRLFWNLRPGTHLIGPDFRDSYAEEVAQYEPACGVSVMTSLDRESSELEVTMGVTSNIAVVYRYIIFLVEDGIDYPQNGDDYIHDNVLRTVMTRSTSGDPLNDKLPLSIGVESLAVKSVKLSSDWNPDNMRVIAAALTSSDGGYTWTVNNVNECAVGESVPYIYAEQ